MAWDPAMISRASTKDGTPFSIAAIVTVSAFERVWRPIVIKRAIVRADGMRWRFSVSAFSARRRRVAHSLTTLSDPRNPYSLRRRHRSALLRHPGVHWASSQGRCTSSELCRARKTSCRSPRMTRRTSCRP